MNEKFTISLEVVVGSKNKQQLSNLTKSIKETSKASGTTTESIEKMNVSLNQLKNMSFSNVLSYISSCSKGITSMTNHIKDFKHAQWEAVKYTTKSLKNVKEFASNLSYTYKDLRKEGYGIKDALYEGFNTGLPDGKDLDSMKSKLGAIKKEWKNIGKVMKTTCLPAIALMIKYLLIIKGITSGIKNAISVAAMGDTIKDEAQKVHLSTTAYQEWGYVLEQNGTTMDNMKMGMRTFSNNVASGNEALKKYGITATNLDEAFEQAIFNIQNLSTETEKVAAMTALFGTRASELMPVLNMTNQETVDLMMSYRALGGTMSNELVAMSDRTTDAILAMKKAWQGLRNTLAYAIIPIVEKVVNWLTVAIGAVNLFLKALFNIKETFGGKSNKEMGSGLASNLSSSAQSAKEIKKTLASFDELNILSSNTSSSSGVDTGIEDMNWDAFNGEGIISSEVMEKLAKIGDWIDKYREKIQLLVPVLTLAAGIALIVMGHPLAGIALAGLGIAIGSANGTWDSIGSLIAGVIKGIWTVFSATFSKIMELMGKVRQAIGDKLVAGFELLKTVIQPILTAFGTVFKAWLDNVITPVLNGFVSIIKTSITTAKGVFDGIITFLKGVFTGNWKMAWEGIKKIVSSVSTGIVNITKTIITTFKTITQPVSEVCEKVMGKVKTLISNVITKVGTVKGKVKTAISNVSSTVLTSLSNLWKKMKSNVATGFKNVMNNVISLVESAVNRIANKFNSTGLLRGINKILGTSIQLPTISIPRLAKGGVITAPTVAMMGEYAGASNNPEIATPQKLLTEIIKSGNDELIDVIVQMCRQMISAIENQDMSVSIGDDVIARSANRGNQQYKNRTGKPLFGY